MRDLTDAATDPEHRRDPEDPTDRARAAIDGCNRDDPSRHDGEPLALAEGRLAEDWVTRLDPRASTAVRLAARAHHLRRWMVPRTSYPAGRDGYLRWRRDQKARHATELATILDAVGVDAGIGERAATIVTKKGLGSDPEIQLFEDAVSLTFLQTQLGSTTEKVGDDAKMVDVVAKTLAKMSSAARAAAPSIGLDPRAAEIVARAIAVHDRTATAGRT